MFREIEDFYRVEDEDDWYPAITRAQNTFTASNAQGNFRGFTIVFRPREYHFSATIQLVRGMSIVGSGGALSGTMFIFPRAVHGIICHTKESAPTATPGAGAWSIVERVIIQATWDPADPPVHGILIQARMTVRDVQISQFSGDGIHISANINATPATNANCWQLQNCRIDMCRNGLYVHGPDANSGCAIGLDCSDNREWGIVDDSFLGNTYIACHTDGNDAGGYKTIDDLAPGHNNPMCLFLNCYAEGGQPYSMIREPSMVMGGNVLVDPTCKPTWLRHGSFENPIRGASWRPEGAAETIVQGAILGSSSSAVNAALELHRFAYKPTESINPVEDPFPYRFQYEPMQPGWWELVYASSGTSPFRFSTQKVEEAVGASQVWMENGFYIGRGQERLRVVVDSQAPPANPDLHWHRGDHILNSNPVAGDLTSGWAGWICVQAGIGSKSQWKPYGRIE